MLYANWDTLSTTWGTTSWIKATPSCESCTTSRQQHNNPMGTSGSNPSTESNKYSKRKAVDKYADAMLEIEVQPNAESRGFSKQQLDSWITQHLERNNGKAVVTECILSIWELPTVSSANSPSREMGDGSYPLASSFKVYGSYSLVLKPNILRYRQRDTMRAAGLASSLRLLLQLRLCGTISRWFEKLVARAVDRYDDVGVMHSLLLVVNCVVLVAADQQARL
ncbi:hypothetical protein F511_36662 [Dorcoceras hygrometricum]|uniref:Uncharacterized protein n=1 Tax=Dorcoceras hygrometricum TaxID=472368 RepID=A0A2Z7BUH1_9LAMI|nr:hypothetical protein F511_36662 [Dorcoceras hygrometricum]